MLPERVKNIEIKGNREREREREREVGSERERKRFEHAE